ncbi:MAG: PEP-CTERM sorting domain-containing protein [Acetobacteraceae bacterium]
MTKTSNVISLLSAGALVGLTSVSALGATVVSPGSMGDWAFNNRDVNVIVGAEPTAIGWMVNGPATPPLGTGSANLATGNGTTGGDGSSELRNTGYAGTLLSSLTTLSYSTYMTQNNGQQFPYFGLVISTTGGATADNTIFFEPPYQTPGTGNPSLPDQGATALNTWQTWDALNGAWWDNNGTCTGGTGVDSLAACLGADFATATIVNAANGLGGVRFNVGFASANDQFNGYVDNFTIGINGANTTYDFELTDVQVPEPATLGLLGTAVAGMVAFARRRRSAR